MLELQKLLDGGYEVYFSKDPAGYVASVSGPEGYEHDAIAGTPGAALWAASPLHPEDEPYPGDGPLVQEVASLRHQVADLLSRQIAVEAIFEAGREAIVSA